MSSVLIHSLAFAPDRVSTAYLMTDVAVQLDRLGHEVSVLTTTPHYNPLPSSAPTSQQLKRRVFGLWYESWLGDVRIWHITVGDKDARIWARGLQFLSFHAMSLILGLFIIKRHKVVLCTSPPLTIGIVNWILCLRWRARSIYKLAELYPDLAIEQGVIRGRLAIKLWRSLEQLVYSTCSVVVPIAEQFRKTLIDRGVPENKIELIPDHVDTNLYRPDASGELPHIFSELEDQFVVLYAGNIGPFQDWHSVVSAAGDLIETSVHFVIIGDGSERSWLGSRVTDLGLTNVTLLNYLPRNTIPAINSFCDIALIPLTWSGSRGGFPSKIYSTLASGCPVLVSAPPGSEMARFVENAGCGRAVEPESGPALRDAILKAYEERHLLPREGLRGREVVERRYSLEAVCGEYDKLIRRLAREATNG